MFGKQRHRASSALPKFGENTPQSIISITKVFEKYATENHQHSQSFGKIRHRASSAFPKFWKNTPQNIISIPKVLEKYATEHHQHYQSFEKKTLHSITNSG
ncbi:hypothetical protein ElyMa_002468800 [Elysia marginata]|uniref:Uncharacterized protein n=1 Tax=Elysia marginata TaxID=1093978 RepID=A0AAV4GL49_9GAST|nr:hypothetical protein ElyMa_002468800 [Elysia marginata]